MSTTDTSAVVVSSFRQSSFAVKTTVALPVPPPQPFDNASKSLVHETSEQASVAWAYQQQRPSGPGNAAQRAATHPASAGDPRVDGVGRRRRAFNRQQVAGRLADGGRRQVSDRERRAGVRLIRALVGGRERHVAGGARRTAQVGQRHVLAVGPRHSAAGVCRTCLKRSLSKKRRYLVWGVFVFGFTPPLSASQFAKEAALVASHGTDTELAPGSMIGATVSWPVIVCWQSAVRVSSSSTVNVRTTVTASPQTGVVASECVTLASHEVVTVGVPTGGGDMSPGHSWKVAAGHTMLGAISVTVTVASHESSASSLDAVSVTPTAGRSAHVNCDLLSSKLSALSLREKQKVSTRPPPLARTSFRTTTRRRCRR